MLWVAAALAAIGGMPQLAIAIVCVVVINGIFSFAQEERASRAAAAIMGLMPAQASVVREGRTVMIDAEALVPGDVVVLKEGDRISADARLIATDGLLVDMSTLTGESLPVARAPTASQGGGEPSAAQNLVFARTHVVAGSASAVVFRTGAATALGTIAQLTGSVVRRPTPLQNDLRRTVRIVASFAVAAGGSFFGVSLALGTPARDGFLFAVAVIVALVPEGLLPTVTLALAVSALRMSHRGALIRRPEAVETLGATTVICSDKTGTMTTNQMTVRVVDSRLGRVRATGLGWGPGGSLFVDDRPVSDAARTFLHPLLRCAALCGEADLELADGAWRCVGDPTEGALVAFPRKGGVERDAEERRTPRMRSFPFDSRPDADEQVHVLADGSLELLVKGAPESILARCDGELVGERAEPLDPANRAGVLARVDELSGEGFRVLALAKGMSLRPSSHVVFGGGAIDDLARPRRPGGSDPPRGPGGDRALPRSRHQGRDGDRRSPQYGHIGCASGGYRG